MKTPSVSRPNDARRHAFTLIEVLVVVAIIALLISILLPSLARAKEMSRRAVCAARLHNMGVAVTTYAHDNKGKIIECLDRDTQVAIGPRIVNPQRASSTTPDYQLVDWHAAGKKYKLDKITWECPNREGVFMYEGNPSLTDQGYTSDMLTAQGYRVYTEGSTGKFNQWIIGYQYFGGMRKWQIQVTDGAGGSTLYNARSPVDANSPGHWALAADSNVWTVEGKWGGDRRAWMNIPPHPDKSGWPEGGNNLTLDGAVNWVHESRMYRMNNWHNNDNRRCYWYQQDLGEYGLVRAKRTDLKRGIKRDQW